MKVNKKIMSLILSGILSMSLVVGCSSTDTDTKESKTTEIETKKEEIKEEVDIEEQIEKAYDLAYEYIDDSRYGEVGAGLIKKPDESKIELMVVCNYFNFKNFVNQEELKENLITDCQEMNRIYEENNLSIEFEVNVKTYPMRITFLTINKKGITLDNYNDEFIENADNWNKR